MWAEIQTNAFYIGKFKRVFGFCGQLTCLRFDGLALDGRTVVSHPNALNVQKS
jgi:hypothetical protein